LPWKYRNYSKDRKYTIKIDTGELSNFLYFDTNNKYMRETALYILSRTNFIFDAPLQKYFHPMTPVEESLEYFQFSIKLGYSSMVNAFCYFVILENLHCLSSPLVQQELKKHKDQVFLFRILHRYLDPNSPNYDALKKFL
jgi:hypothetical protein